jgi:hypothetical protein
MGNSFVFFEGKGELARFYSMRRGAGATIGFSSEIPRKSGYTASEKVVPIRRIP